MNGDLIFARCYGSFESDQAYDVSQTSDGGFLVTGYASESSGDVAGNYGGADVWVIKIDSIGNLLWEKNYGGSATDFGESILEMDNGNILCAGYTHSNDGLVTDFHGFEDSWIICLDSLGNLLWQHTYGGSGGDLSNEIISLSSNSYVFVGGSGLANGDVTSNYGNTDCWAVCIDSLGEILWQKSYGGSNFEDAFSSIYTYDSCIVTSGYTISTDFDVTSTYDSYNYWVVKLSICSNHYYADVDNDGYGDVLSDSIACELPFGFVSDSTDCNDANNLVHPFVSDICNSIDDNCNVSIDEDAFFATWYLDGDADGYGNILFDSISCFELMGYVFDSTDCNDENIAINPGKDELCNTIDDNCNELIDEDLVFELYFIDEDGDNFGNSAIDSLWCVSVVGFVLDSTDCNDTNPDIYPSAIEILNGLDDDCDGLTDENLAINNALLDAIRIYPNPTETILHIEYAGNSTCRIEILSVTGEVIYRNELSSTTTIDISKFASGIYFLKIMNADGDVGVKVVKE
jgi:hypothetical protein